MPEHEDPSAPPVVYWEDRYAGSDRVWSGNPNSTTASIAADLESGTALDLGCGEGADAIWLAQQGARVTGVDISATAIERATAAAHNLGLPTERIRFIAADLDGWQDDQTYDLVTASFLQSPVELDRIAVLQRASTKINPGGHLLLVAHAAMPPWASGNHHEFISPADEIASLGLDMTDWTIRLAEVRSRPATGPDGQEAVLDDSVVLLRRER